MQGGPTPHDLLRAAKEKLARQGEQLESLSDLLPNKVSKEDAREAYKALEAQSEKEQRKLQRCNEATDVSTSRLSWITESPKKPDAPASSSKTVSMDDDTV